MRSKPAGIWRESPLELVHRDHLSMPRLEGTLQAHRHSCWLLVSPRICPSGGRGELSFSQHGYLWPEYFNLALDFENGSRKNLIFSIHILMVVVKLQEETEM